MACRPKFGVHLSSLVRVTVSAYRFSFDYRRNGQENLQLKYLFVYQFSLSFTSATFGPHILSSGLPP
jgi:hypothetical protein